MTTRVCLLAAVLGLAPLGLPGQGEKSPDQQQQQHDQNTPPPQATAPGAQKQLPAADTGATPKRAKKRKTKRTVRGTGETTDTAK